jgi:hypothetical protein
VCKKLCKNYIPISFCVENVGVQILQGRAVVFLDLLAAENGGAAADIVDDLVVVAARRHVLGGGAVPRGEFHLVVVRFRGRAGLGARQVPKRGLQARSDPTYLYCIMRLDEPNGDRARSPFLGTFR